LTAWLNLGILTSNRQCAKDGVQKMITITPLAARKIQQTLNRRGHGVGVRIGVKTTGCSGLAYVLEYVDSPAPEDQCVECLDCKVFIDPKSCAYVQGTEIDFVRNGLNEGFEFRNPNERDRCGCGESFRV
jgi:iron-sulfur cluster assembly protein